MYHMAFSTQAIEEDMRRLEERVNAKVIIPVREAVYFAKIAFAMVPKVFLIELR